LAAEVEEVLPGHFNETAIAASEPPRALMVPLEARPSSDADDDLPPSPASFASARIVVSGPA